VRDRWLWLLVLVMTVGCGGPAKSTVNLERQAISYNEAGYNYYRQSRLNLARDQFEQALNYNRLIDRRSGIASNLNNLGVIAQQQGDLKQAVNYFQEALAINRELDSPTGLSETLNNLGLAYQSQGHLHQAEAAYAEALEYARQVAPGPLLTLSLTHLGDVARASKEYMLAISYYHQALMADEGTKDQRGRAMREERLGRTFYDLQDYGRATMYLNESLKHFRRLQDTDGIVAALKDLTLVALARSDHEAARLNASLLMGIYQARGQEQAARELKALLQKGGVR
jgi:tetratricopeptide (TPR) repeat protein